MVQLFSPPYSSITRPEILSGPCALLTFILFIMSEIRFRFIMIVSRFEFVIGVKSGKVLLFVMGIH